MGFRNIILEKTARVATIILNRPQVLNALNSEMWQEIGEALEDIEQDDTIRVAIITGNGKAFSAGADLKRAKEILGDPKRSREYIQLIHRVLGKIESLSKPVIAVVNGIALAGGFEIVLACDIVIASEDARLGDQHAHYALVPGGGSTQRTPRTIGIKRAKEHLLTGDWYSATEAERVGLVNHVVPADKLNDAVNEMVAKLVDKSPLGSAIIKELVNQGMNTDLGTALNLEIGAVVFVSRTEDFREGMSAFEEKREPVYKGK